MSSPQRANLSPSSGMEKVKRGTIHSLASGKHNESHVVLPTLSLRKQVLINGKHLSMPSPTPHQQVPPTATVTTTIQTGHCFSNNSFKGKNKSQQKILIFSQPRVGEQNEATFLQSSSLILQYS